MRTTEYPRQSISHRTSTGSTSASRQHEPQRGVRPRTLSDAVVFALKQVLRTVLDVVVIVLMLTGSAIGGSLALIGLSVLVVAAGCAGVLACSGLIMTVGQALETLGLM